MLIKRLFAQKWLRVSASLVLILLCLSLVQPTEMIEALRRTNPWYFLVAFVLNALGTVLIRAWTAHLTTSASGLVLGYGELVRINLIARFYTLILPRGASTAIRWQRYRRGGSGFDAAALLLFESLVSVFILFLTAAVILTFKVSQMDIIAIQILLPLSWAGALIMLFSLMPFLHISSADIVVRLMQPLVQKSRRFSEVTERFLTAIVVYRTIPKYVIAVIFFASALGYVFFVLSGWVLAKGMLLDVSLVDIAWVRSITLLVTLLPITIAGIGLREGAFIALLYNYGITPSEAFTYAITLFVIQLLLGVFGALLEIHGMLYKNDKTAVSNNAEDSRS